MIEETYGTNKYTIKSRVETRVSISKNQLSKYVGLVTDFRGLVCQLGSASNRDMLLNNSGWCS